MLRRVLWLVLTLVTLAWLTPARPVQPSFASLPLAFEEGPEEASFLARGAGYALAAETGEMTMAWSGPQPGHLRLRPEGGRLQKPVASDRLVGTVNYLFGSDPARWRTGIRTFARVAYSKVYPGVDLVLYGNQRQVEHDWLVAPGADPNQIALTYEGCEELAVDAHGNLVVHTGQGSLVQPPPTVYQVSGGRRDSVSGRYELRGTRTVGFALGAYDGSRELVIDPVVYSTYVGGAGNDVGTALALDATGTYLAGETTGSFPVSGGSFQVAYGGGALDAFVTKLNATGTAVLYSTYLGGNGDEGAAGVAVDGSGNAYLTGTTSGGTFPTTGGAFQTVPQGSQDVFVTKLNPTGTALVYSTFVAGPAFEQGNGIAVDAAGFAYVTGFNRFGGFPVTGGAAQTVAGGINDAFITKLNVAGSALVYSTLLGGANDEAGNGIALDPAGNAYIAGRAVAPGTLPINGPASQPVYGGGSDDAFVARLNATGSAFIYSTYLGGPGTDVAQGIAVTPGGNAYVVGNTDGSFPITAGAAQTGYGGGSSDAFVACLSGTSVRLFSSYLGGSQSEEGRAIAVDGSGNAYLTGSTQSVNFPLAGIPAQASRSGLNTDAFVTELNATGSTFLYSSYFGGPNVDVGRGIAVNAAAEISLTGSAGAAFPVTAGAAQTVFGGGATDAFAARLGLDPAPTPTPPPPSTTNVTVTPPDQTAAVAPGTTHTFTFRVQNTGDTADGYDVAVSGGSVTPTRLFLSANQSAEVQLTVTVPSGATAGGSGRLTVRSTSRPSIVATATFSYTLGQPARTFSVALQSGWNAVGFDLASVSSVTANPAILQRAAFVAGSYDLAPLSVASLNPTTRGYWVFSTQATTLDVSGPPAPGGNNVPLSAGWNLVAFPGSPTALRVFEAGSQVPLDSVVLPIFYALQPDRTMVPVDLSAGGQLTAGRAYWVFAFRPAELRY